VKRKKDGSMKRERIPDNRTWQRFAEDALPETATRASSQVSRRKGTAGSPSSSLFVPLCGTLGLWDFGTLGLSLSVGLKDAVDPIFQALQRLIPARV
jgi:hypothetical protein